MDAVFRAERVLIDGVLRPATVAVERGLIVDIGDFDDHRCGVDVEVPVAGVLLPGFVDTHVHVNDPGTDWEGFPSATAAATAAGITTVVDMPLDSDPVTTTVAALGMKRSAAAGNCTADVSFWGGVVPGNLDDIEPLATAGVRGFKCFLTTSGNPNFDHLSPPQFREAMARIAELDSVLLVHAESHDAIAGAPHACGDRYGSFLESRPDVAEVDAVELVVQTAAETGARVHIVHVSSAQVLPLIADAKASGAFITAETCPHYLTFSAETIPNGATEFAACPPIRGAANREALWVALLDGTIDMVVSDHSPCAPEVKGHGDFGRVFGGISSLELGPRAVWTHAVQRGFELADLSRWMSTAPAELAGFTDRGRIATGRRADLCVFDPDAGSVVDVGALHHRHPMSPWDGVALRGAILQTWVAGKRVADRVGKAV